MKKLFQFVKNIQDASDDMVVRRLYAVGFT